MLKMLLDPMGGIGKRLSQPDLLDMLALAVPLNPFVLYVVPLAYWKPLNLRENLQA
jgi:hypothetical protein